MPCLPMSAIPGLNEPKLHKINNYLFQLNKLWSGYNVIICKYNNSHFVWGVVISYFSDVPAIQKLCFYLCTYHVLSVNNQPNFGGFADFDKWFVKQDINTIRENERVYNWRSMYKSSYFLISYPLVRNLLVALF